MDYGEENNFLIKLYYNILSDNHLYTYYYYHSY